ncbi:MAG: rod shape-determining protein RodA [Bacteroidetes bacterium 4484_276]|nr:MAG: rod shape-determining protein RodA [Bacteroidetes bacterium 4484_276]
MVRSRTNILTNIDWWLILLYIVLVLMGWINIYAAVYDEDHSSILDMSQNYGKQLVWILTSVVLVLIILITDAKFFSSFSILIYILMIGALVGVLLFGKEIAGSKSWFQFGSVSIQPAEFAKFATNLAMAKYLSTLNLNLKNIRSLLKAVIILAIPASLILLQNDTGSTLVYSAFIFVLYREGMPGGILIIGLALVVLFLMALLINKFIFLGILVLLAALFILMMKRTLTNIMAVILIFIAASGFVLSVDYAFENILEPHHRSRINVLLGKETDIHGAGYNVHQSLIAIGSGGVPGKGFLNGTQTKYNFVPEQSTDFIFCTVGEEWGFIGSLIVVLLFVILLIRLIVVAERQRSKFARIYGYGVASIIFFHFTVNVAMTLGLFPVIGIPLPFFSYGGSSLWAFTILLFIFIKMDSDRMNLLY